MNIKFNFATQNAINQVVENQELAVMPATMAQKLLRIYARELTGTTNRDIIVQHIKTLSTFAENNDLDSAIKESLAWVAERDLIQNIQHENWEAYNYTPTETEQPTFASRRKGYENMPDNGGIALNQAH